MIVQPDVNVIIIFMAFIAVMLYMARDTYRKYLLHRLTRADYQYHQLAFDAAHDSKEWDDA
jgi:hypothetical protein